MRFVSLIIPALALSCASLGNAQAGPALTNLVVNGSFSAPSVSPTVNGNTVTGSTELGSFSFNGTAYTSTEQGWSVNGNNPYTLWYQASNATSATAFSRYDSASTSGTGYTGNEYFRSIPGADGTNPNFIAMDGDPGVEGGIYQKFTNLVPGTVYEISFDYAAAQLVTGNGSYSLALYYNLGGSSTLNTATAAFVQAMSNGSSVIPQGGTAPWTTKTAYFEATSATEYLSFLALGGSGEPPIALLDNVAMYAVPEPSTLALLCGGLGLAGFMWRRRAAAV